MSSITKRRTMIRSLIHEHAVHTQEELSHLLAAQGIQTTQTTLSRDIAALGLIKQDGRYHSSDAPPTTRQVATYLQNRILEIKTAGPYIVVIRTSTGEAGAVGLQIDRANWSEAVGTVAGDDTVFIACDDPAASGRLMQKLRDIAPDAFS
ncbi:MAG TPA: arginine repressor [bacterium]|nr:arginine repressor [bacterium]